ncbi:MAG: ABC transporter ATP-binding protein [Burkholderiaceae bacterium]|nr:ABC transporter ATP-binding protein [Burkholderiaceae bacterium]
MRSPLLEVEGIESGYGLVQVLRKVSIEISRGRVATLIGRNGMGKSTIVKTLTGRIKARAGRIRFAGTDITDLPDWRIARCGIGLVPEGRSIFPNLTVEENLVCGAANRHGATAPWTLGRVYSMFPRLRERRSNAGANLSGGEQQMLAIGRALMTNPLLLILDEATEGLAPLIRLEIWTCLEILKGEGLAMLVIDKNLEPLSRLADQHYVLEKGCIVWQGDAQSFRANLDYVSRWVGV